MVSAALLQVMSSGFKSAKHVELKSDVVALTNTLRGSIDCDRTFANGVGGGPVNIAAHCGGAPVPITLLSRSGTPIHGALAAGAFSPTAPNFAGSGQLGDWQIRAYCDAGLGSLVVRIAQRGSGPNGFRVDPLSKIAIDWQKPPNPVIGGVASQICANKFGGVLIANCPNPATEKMVGMNFSTTPPTPICAPSAPPWPLVQCAVPGQTLIGVNFTTNPPSPVCASPNVTAWGSVQCPDPAGHKMYGVNFATSPPTPLCNPVPHRYGGSYTRHVGYTWNLFGNSHGTPNPMTGTHSCPPGYNDQMVFSWHGGCGPYWHATAPSGPSVGEFSPYGVRYMIDPAAPAGAICGMEAHVCTSNP